MRNDKSLAQRVAHNKAASHRIASRYFEQRYAKLIVSMSLQEAKSILGFPPNSNPSKEEVSKAYRTRAFENHPDRGGDLKKMVEVNVARDLLQSGNIRQTWQPVTPKEEPFKRWQDDPETVIVKGQGFAQAYSSSGCPADVTWKFISTQQFATNDETRLHSYVWVMYGQTDSKHVFLALKYNEETPGHRVTTKYGPKTHFEENWTSNLITAPLTQDLVKIAAKHIKSAATSWADGDTCKVPTKFFAWPGAPRPTKEILKKVKYSGGVPLKTVLLGTGLIKSDSAVALSRKTQVELVCRKRPDNAWKEGELSARIELFVRINGKEAQLAPDTVDKLGRSILYKFFLPFNWFQDGAVKNLSQTKKWGGAALAIQSLSDCLTNEPSWVHIALEQAIEDYTVEPEAKKASALIYRSNTDLFTASKTLGLSPFDLFNLIHT